MKIYNIGNSRRRNNKIVVVTILAVENIVPLATFEVAKVHELAFNLEGTLLYIQRGRGHLWGVPTSSE